MRPASEVTVDLGAVEANVGTIRRACGVVSAGRGSVGICAVLKADGYGMGAVALARFLESCGVEMFAVYGPRDARALIEAGLSTPALALMPARGEDLGSEQSLADAAGRGRLIMTVHSREQGESLAAWAERMGVRLPVHVEVDTGMSRGGVSEREAAALLRWVSGNERLGLCGVMSHFASADRDQEMTEEQSARLGRVLADAADALPAHCVAHLANTAGTFRSAGLHRDMVRVGLALLGYAAEEVRDAERLALGGHADALRPAVRWTSRIVHESRIAAGATVGYGSTWRAARESRLGLIPVGYADGYPLALSNRGGVGMALPAGGFVYAPVVGAVNMDQITVDLTDAPATVGVGTPVEVVGTSREAPTFLPRLARTAGSTTWEMLCRVSARVPRRFVQPARAEGVGSSEVAPSVEGPRRAAV